MLVYTVPYEKIGMQDVHLVGGKNASLGEMITNLSHLHIKVPGGFATTTSAFNDFLYYKHLNQRISKALETLDVNQMDQLKHTGQQIREWIINQPFTFEFETAVIFALNTLQTKEKDQNISFAVRSSATAEDLPSASFAGQQETYLNIQGISQILSSIKQVFASLYNDRAISYRAHQGFGTCVREISISAGIQKMVRSDVASSGVMFTLDTESGFKDVVFITSSYGLGEMVVQGAVNPDEFYIHKPTLQTGRPAIVRRNLGSKKIKMVYASSLVDDETVSLTSLPEDAVQMENVPEPLQKQYSLNDKEITYLAQQAVIIEQHYQMPMDIEWAKDGINGELYIVQARPETVVGKKSHCLEQYILQQPPIEQQRQVVISGRAIGQKIGAGKAKILKSSLEIDKIEVGDVLVTDMTDPQWEPIMKKASAIVTNRGGRTCHAAIIAREMGIPAIVGCENATSVIYDGEEITVSCAQGDVGMVYQGVIPFEIVKSDISDVSAEITNSKKKVVDITMNVGNPNQAFNFSQIPNQGVGLARMEFIINHMIGVHPKALLEYDSLQDLHVKSLINVKLTGIEVNNSSATAKEYFIYKLTEGISTLACAFTPKKVIVRTSDFKSNEYSSLIGGHLYEPEEENPMLGFRGASRYVSHHFQDCFALELEAFKRVRNDMGFTNVEIMIPFVRTLEEARKVTELLETHGLKRGENGLKVIMMCEIPSNCLLAGEFLEYFDGFSIGSNDLTQLTLGLDRDSGLLSHLFDERNAAVKILMEMAIRACKERGKYVGICGQGPSDHPDFALWLIEQGIDSISLNPDTVLETCQRYKFEKK